MRAFLLTCALSNSSSTAGNITSPISCLKGLLDIGVPPNTTVCHGYTCTAQQQGLGHTRGERATATTDAARARWLMGRCPAAQHHHAAASRSHQTPRPATVTPALQTSRMRCAPKAPPALLTPVQAGSVCAVRRWMECNPCCRPCCTTLLDQAMPTLLKTARTAAGAK